VSRLENKIAFVTGAAGGIGSAIARRFLAEGACLAATDRDRSAIHEALGVSGDNDQLVTFAGDIGDTDLVRDTIAAAAERFGKIDILSNNAGGSSPQDARVTDVSDDEFWRVIRTDLFGTFAVCKHGIPELVKAGGGSVINMSSMCGLMAVPDRDCYTAAKGGVSAMTRSMAYGYAPDKIRVNAIAPGITMTPRVAARMDMPAMQRFMPRHLLGLVEAKDIANLALFLASDESSHITGQILQVDSGVTIN
jgi:NAD(P)-dependent dehydrogenase (short-subunit alcohol dehydrogenase family)